MGNITSVTSLLGGITSTLNTIDNFTNTVQNFGGQDTRAAEKNLAASQSLALQQLQQQQTLEQQNAASDAALQRQSLALDAAATEEARQRALRRVVASQRAAYGGSGISTSGGSADAVLLGFVNDSSDEKSQNQKITQLKNAALSESLTQKNSLNVLQLSQLREKQALNRSALF